MKLYKRPQKRPCEYPISITGKITSLLCISTVSSSISHTNVQDQKHPAQSHAIHIQISWPLLQGHPLELNLLPLNYWLEYLDIVYFFKGKLGLIDLKRNDLYEFCSEHSRHGASSLFLKNMKAKTSPYRDSFFVRICNT